MPDDYTARLWAMRPDDEEFPSAFRLAFGREMTPDERRYFRLSSIAIDDDDSNLSSSAAAGS